jgi:hypothetical protein
VFFFALSFYKNAMDIPPEIWLVVYWLGGGFAIALFAILGFTFLGRYLGGWIAETFQL